MGPITIALALAAREAFKRWNGGSRPATPTCVIRGCGGDAPQQTRCCQMPLCPDHLRAWLEMDAPCPCHQSR